MMCWCVSKPPPSTLLDSKVRDGEFKLILPYRLPFILGHDLAGTVLRVGVNVRRFKAGDAVFARPRDHRIGTFAEFIAVDQDDVAIKPASLTMAEAASIPLVALTAWQALVEVGQVKPGQKVFIQAGSGRGGHDCHSIGQTSGGHGGHDDKCRNADLVRSLGADVVIDYRTEDFEQVLSGYDLVLNSQDPKTLAKSLNVLKAGRQADFDLGAAGSALCQIAATEPVPAVPDAHAQPVLCLKKAKARGIDYSFLFMKADGAQLALLAS